jgi:hypothetical protein
MATSIVKPTPNKEEVVLQSKLNDAKSQAEALTVRNPEECAIAKTFLKSMRDVIKQIGFLKDPGIDSARKHLDFLKEDKAQWVRQAMAAEAVAEGKVNAWTRAEREAAEKEQQRINEENRRKAALLAEDNRKAAEAAAEVERKRRAKEIADAQKAGEVGKREAEKLKKQAEEEAERKRQEAAKQAEIDAANVPQVTVKPNIPAVAGTRSRRNVKFRILDELRIPRAYLTPNEIKIGARVRFYPDKSKPEAQHKLEVEGEIAGIEVFFEDSN